MKISVIVPVYNVQDYIVECLESIMIQELKDIEIIIVNDGSTDKSISNIQNIIDNNSNIHLINKVNGGLSSARNTGLSHAKGEYVLFVDSDDYLEKDFLYKLYNEAKEYDLDIACGGYRKYFSDDKIVRQTRNNKLMDLGVIKGVDFLLVQLENNDYRMEVWDDLYRREFLINNNLLFTENLLHEDEDFTPRALLLASRVKLVNTYGYLYRQRENSIMSAKCTIKNVESIYYIIHEFKKLFKKSQNEVEKKCLSQLTLKMCNIYYGKVLICNEKDKYHLAKKIDFFQISRELYKNHLTFKQKLKYNIPYLALLNFKKKELIQRFREVKYE